MNNYLQLATFLVGAYVVGGGDRWPIYNLVTDRALRLLNLTEQIPSLLAGRLHFSGYHCIEMPKIIDWAYTAELLIPEPSALDHCCGVIPALNGFNRLVRQEGLLEFEIEAWGRLLVATVRAVQKSDLEIERVWEIGRSKE